MKDQVMQQLGFVLNALNNVYVKGKANLANLSHSRRGCRRFEQCGNC